MGNRESGAGAWGGIPRRPLRLLFVFVFAFVLAFPLVPGRHVDLFRSLTAVVSGWPPPGPTLSLRKPPRRKG